MKNTLSEINEIVKSIKKRTDDVIKFMLVKYLCERMYNIVLNQLIKEQKNTARTPSDDV